MPYNAEKIIRAYKSKHNFKRKKKVILLMITAGKKLHYLAVKSLSALLRWIKSSHKGEFYCVGSFILTAQKTNLKNMKEYAMIIIIVM